MHLLVWIAAGALGLGIGSGMVRSFERSAASEIRSLLQTTEGSRVDVRVQPDGLRGIFGELEYATIRASRFSLDGLPLFTEPQRSKAGKLGSLNLLLEDFTLRGLRIERLEARIPNCRYDLGLALGKRRIRISRSGVGTGEVTILERDLEAWILRKFREIKRVSVRVDRDRVWVEGFGEFLLAKTEFQVIADLAAIGGTALHLINAKIYFNWVPVDSYSRDQLLKTLNPVVDLRADLGLYNAITVEAIRLRDGKVVARGQTRIPDLPESPEVSGIQHADNSYSHVPARARFGGAQPAADLSILGFTDS